jgi:uncharacterized membrane protein
MRIEGAGMSQVQQQVIKEARMAPWLQGCIACFYFALIAGLALFPGGTLIERLRWLDSGICAQLATHSFYPGGVRLPLCARNTGIYLGFLLTLITFYATGRGRAQQLPSWQIILVLGCGVLALGIDGFNSLALDLGLPHLYQPNNLLRLTTGLLTGLTLASLALPIFNQLFWRQYNQQRSIGSWQELLLLLPTLVIGGIICVSQQSIALYPLALLSTAGILSAIGSVNLIAVIAVGKRQETFTRYQELLPFFALAIIFAIIEMIFLAQAKVFLLHALGA